MSFGSQFVKFADSETPETSAPRRTSVFYNNTSDVIEDGSLVSIDTDTTNDQPYGVGASVHLSQTTLGVALSDLFNVVGVADRDIDPGTWGPVVTFGVKTACKASGTPVGRSVGVVSSGTHIGAVWGAGVGEADVDHNYIGFSLAASYDGDNLVDLFVMLG